MVEMDVDIDDFVQNATHAAEMNATTTLSYFGFVSEIFVPSTFIPINKIIFGEVLRNHHHILEIISSKDATEM